MPQCSGTWTRPCVTPRYIVSWAASGCKRAGYVQIQPWGIFQNNSQTEHILVGGFNNFSEIYCSSNPPHDGLNTFLSNTVTHLKVTNQKVTMCVLSLTSLLYPFTALHDHHTATTPHLAAPTVTLQLALSGSEPVCWSFRPTIIRLASNQPISAQQWHKYLHLVHGSGSNVTHRISSNSRHILKRMKKKL